MKFVARLNFCYFSLLLWVLSAASGIAAAAGPEDDFPPGGQMPAGWATSLGAAAGWNVATDFANGGAYSLKSAPLPDDPTNPVSKTAAIQVGGTFSAGNVSFAYQVSSESPFDTIEFYIDDNKVLSATGVVAWTNASFPVAAGDHVFKWVYAKDESNGEGSDAAWIDTVVLPSGTPQPLLSVTLSGNGGGTVASNPAGINCGTACSADFTAGNSVTLTASTRPGSRFAGWSGSCSGTSATCTVTLSAARAATATFTLADDNFPPNGQMPAGWTASPGSNLNWKVATDSTHFGGFSLKSGAVGDGQKSAIQFNATVGSGTIDFSYKVSSEASYDWFTFYIDDVFQFANSGDVDWTDVSVPVAAGLHVFKFVYQKDVSVLGGGDAAWIDSVVLPGTTTKVLTIVGAGSGAGTVSGAPAGINCGTACSASFATGSTVTLTATSAAGSVFNGWTGACNGASATCQVVMDTAKTAKATFWVPGMSGVLDIDGSGAPTRYDALTDGMLVMRYLFGNTGTALTSGTVAATATRKNATAIQAYLDDNRSALDIDGSGSTDALTDGLLIMRYMFGIRSAGLISGAVGATATRTTPAQIEAYLQTLMP